MDTNMCYVQLRTSSASRGTSSKTRYAQASSNRYTTIRTSDPRSIRLTKFWIPFTPPDNNPAEAGLHKHQAIRLKPDSTRALGDPAKPDSTRAPAMRLKRIPQAPGNPAEAGLHKGTRRSG